MWFIVRFFPDFLRLKPIFCFSINTIYVFFYTNFFPHEILRERIYRVKTELGILTFCETALNFCLLTVFWDNFETKKKKYVSAGNWKFQNSLDRVRLYRLRTDADYIDIREIAPLQYLRTCAKLLPFQRSGKYVLSGSLCER